MDPYLEGPAWSSLHFWLISKTAEALQDQLDERGYYATPGERVWVAQPGRAIMPDVALLKPRRRPKREAASSVAVLEPDEPLYIEPLEVEVREPFIEIRDAVGNRLITGIEFVSPTNKSDAQGRELYQKKQRETRDACVHLVEIDLLRTGRNVVDLPQAVLAQLPRWDYLVNIGRRDATRFEVYPIGLRDPLPRIRIPLKAGDEDAVLDLPAVFEQAYRAGRYATKVNYRVDPPIPLADEDAAWARQLLKKNRLAK